VCCIHQLNPPPEADITICVRFRTFTGAIGWQQRTEFHSPAVGHVLSALVRPHLDGPVREERFGPIQPLITMSNTADTESDSWPGVGERSFTIKVSGRRRLCRLRSLSLYGSPSKYI
jgi:hypothetical protein